jgi:hypothetical protein
LTLPIAIGFCFDLALALLSLVLAYRAANFVPRAACDSIAFSQEATVPSCAGSRMRTTPPCSKSAAKLGF